MRSIEDFGRMNKEVHFKGVSTVFGLRTIDSDEIRISSFVHPSKTHMRECLMIVRCFLCNNVARMGLQKTLVTILQGWVYKTQPTCILRCFLWNNIARMGLQKTLASEVDVLFVTRLQASVHKHACERIMLLNRGLRQNRFIHPKRRFGRPNKHFRVPFRTTFRSTFQGCE